MRRIVTGGILALLLLAAYVYGIRDLRTAYVESVVVPVLSAALSSSCTPDARVDARGTIALVGVSRSSSTEQAPPSSDPAASQSAPSLTYHAPMGILFLLPALVLAGWAPAEPYWAYLALWHVVIGAAGLGAVLLAVTGADAGADVYRLIHEYIVPMTSLGAVPLALFQRRAKPDHAVIGLKSD